MKITFGKLQKQAALVLALTVAVGGTLPAKDAPKLNTTEKEVDRSSRGASYAAVIKKVSPSVVTITSSRTVRVIVRTIMTTSSASSLATATASRVAVAAGGNGSTPSRASVQV